MEDKSDASSPPPVTFTSGCRRENGEDDIFYSPTASRSNTLLRGKFNDGFFGLLVRAPRLERRKGKKIEDSTKKGKKGKKSEANYENVNSRKDESRQYLPASLLHASIRAPNSIYSEQFEYKRNRTLPHELPTVALLVGTKNGLNEGKDDNVVTCSGFYPIDSHSGKRKPVVEGTSCFKARNASQNSICVDGRTRCLSIESSHCECNFTAVPGRNYSRHFTAYGALKRKRGNRRNPAAQKAKGRYSVGDDGEEGKANIRWAQPSDKLSRKWLHSGICWARGTHKGLSHMIDASNSIYLHRTEFLQETERIHDNDYYGWTECAASANIEDARMVDAVVIKLPPREEVISLCSLNEAGIELLHTSLKELYWRYGYSSLPVVIMTETKGMSIGRECDELWGGTQCHEGYRKEFMSQTFDFDDGSCLSRPASSADEVYFFAANATDNPCRRGGGEEGGTMLHLRILHASVELFFAKSSSLGISNFPFWQAGKDSIDAVGAMALFSIVVALVFVLAMQCRLHIYAYGRRTASKGDKQA